MLDAPDAGSPKFQLNVFEQISVVNEYCEQLMRVATRLFENAEFPVASIKLGILCVSVVCITGPVGV
ncbi:hypothetical protein D3C80_1116720 [compost metagenome]